jgi:hypothetical protein
MAGSFTVSFMSPLVSPVQKPIRPVRRSRPADPPFSGTGGKGVIARGSPLTSGRTPNHMLTFRSRARKLPETRKNDDQAEQAS